MFPTLLGFPPPPPPPPPPPLAPSTSSRLPSPLSQAKGAPGIAPPHNFKGYTLFSLGYRQATGVCRVDLGSHVSSVPRSSSATGVCRASQTVDIFPSTSSEIIVRDAHIEDCWEVADTHCSTFFPNYAFPLALVLRINRFVGLLSGYSVPPGCMKACLVAVEGCANVYLGNDELGVGDFEGKFSFGRGSVAGILTVDTLADYLPRKGPLRTRRTGIAYLSNVAVRETHRRKGIAKMLVAEAKARARLWGCRAIALHCEITNHAAVNLYKSLGFKSIKVPEHANWPQPKATPDTQFIFMMKIITSGSCKDRWR